MMLLSAARVLSGSARQTIEDGAVLVDGSTITAVGARAQVENLAAPNAIREHYPRCTILPGLINSHVHLAFDTSADPVAALRDLDDESLLTGMLDRAQQALHSGVTTVRDLGDRNGLSLRLRESIARGEVTGPRIVASGPPLTIPEGHCWFLGGVVGSEREIRNRIQASAEAGADFIKVMASGGQLTPGSPPMWQSQFTPHDLQVITTEATRMGLPVAAHAHGSEAIEAAVRAGARTIEHCTWMGANGPDRRSNVAATMAAEGIFACAASSGNWRRFVDKLGPEKAQQVYGRLPWMAELGVPLITGTDAGLPNSVFNDFVSALELYEYLGFTPTDIIEMATTTSAEALGLGSTVGRLESGYFADLLIVDGDPTHSLDALRHHRRVLADGEVR